IKDYAEEPVENFTYIPGGFVESRMAFYQPAEYPPVGFEFNKKQWDAFEEIVTMLQERGIEYVLVMTPLTRDYYQSLTGMPGFDKRMEAYGVYYNFNELLHLEDTVCFRDRDHLNQQGVKLFNQALFSILY
ncbi:MAG: hypothetical protein LUD74_04845, partial [Tannerellaceae bacterium]|nr:hypothetical protein [Tannerellaceae bacterium]